MSSHGSRFDREFTPDDLAIVNMGYWDPNADEDSEQVDSASSVTSSRGAEATSCSAGSASTSAGFELSASTGSTKKAPCT